MDLQNVIRVLTEGRTTAHFFPTRGLSSADQEENHHQAVMPIAWPLVHCIFVTAA